MRRAQNIILALLMMCNTMMLRAQDIHFTQLQYAPLLFNPGATGVFDGWERVSINHKNQWVNSGTKFFTSSISADMNFFKAKGRRNAHMGFGLQLFRDIGGDSEFGTKQVLMNVSSIVPLSKEQTFSAGLQLGLGQKSGDLSNVTFSNQFDGARINQFKNSNESNTVVSSIYSDISAGLMYNYRTDQQKISRSNKVDFKAGISYFHINKPSLKYRLGSTEKLYAKWVGHISLLRDFPSSKVGVEVYLNQAFQGPYRETLIGGLYRYRLSAGSKMTGLVRDTYLMMGLSYRVNDAISPIVYMEHKGFTFGMSYDVTVSKFAQGSSRGGMEFSLSYANLDFALFKRRGGRY